MYGSPLAPGTEAPDFTLRDQDGNAITLSHLRGKNVILVFYPKDETPTCRRQLCEFRDQTALVSAKDAMVFGVNAGDSGSHAAFRAQHGFPFPLLVDEGRRVSKLYAAKGVLWTVRTVYVIGRDGRIVYSKRGKPEVEEVLSAVR